MSIQDTLGTLANNLRSVSGYQDKLSLSDMGSMATGLTTYNLLSNTTSKVKDLSVDYNQWSAILYDNVKLPAGIYTYSIYVDLTNDYNSTSNRVEWTNISGVNKALNASCPVWGAYSNNWILAGNRGLVSVTFQLGVEDTVKFGLSGNPYTKGTIRYSSPMLNLGTFPLPYTSNTLVRGGELNYLFLCCHFFNYLKGW